MPGSLVAVCSYSFCEYPVCKHAERKYGQHAQRGGDEALDKNGWMLCTYEGRKGYINGQYLSEPPGAINGYVASGYMATAMPTETGGYVNLLEKPVRTPRSFANATRATS